VLGIAQTLRWGWTYGRGVKWFFELYALPGATSVGSIWRVELLVHFDARLAQTA
jgi:hypothetical protein